MAPSKLFENFYLIECLKKKNSVPRAIKSFPNKPNLDGDEVSKVIEFCFPDSEQLLQSESKLQESDGFVFVITQSDASQKYGFSLRKEDNASSKIQCMCIVSELNWFEFFMQILNAMQNTENLDCFLLEIYQLDLPSPKSSVYMKIPGPTLLLDESYQFFRLGENEVNFTPLFEQLDPEQILAVFASLLFERHVIFVSKSIAAVSSCIHCSASLLYPFKWEHIYIPILPKKLLDYATAPMPYIIGVHTTSLSLINKMPIDNVVIVHLDDKEILFFNEDVDLLPSSLSEKLLKSLNKIASGLKKGQLNSEAVSNAFLKFFLSIFSTYGNFVSNGIFDRNSFLKSHTPPIQNFLNTFYQSQLCEQTLKILAKDYALSKENQNSSPYLSRFKEQVALLQSNNGSAPKSRKVIEMFESLRTTIVTETSSLSRATGLKKVGILKKTNSETEMTLSQPVASPSNKALTQVITITKPLPPIPIHKTPSNPNSPNITSSDSPNLPTNSPSTAQSKKRPNQPLPPTPTPPPRNTLSKSAPPPKPEENFSLDPPKTLVDANTDTDNFSTPNYQTNPPTSKRATWRKSLGTHPDRSLASRHRSLGLPPPIPASLLDNRSPTTIEEEEDQFYIPTASSPRLRISRQIVLSSSKTPQAPFISSSLPARGSFQGLSQFSGITKLQSEIYSQSSTKSNAIPNFNLQDITHSSSTTSNDTQETPTSPENNTTSTNMNTNTNTNTQNPPLQITKKQPPPLPPRNKYKRFVVTSSNDTSVNNNNNNNNSNSSNPPLTHSTTVPFLTSMRFSHTNPLQSPFPLTTKLNLLTKSAPQSLETTTIHTNNTDKPSNATSSPIITNSNNHNTHTNNKNANNNNNNNNNISTLHDHQALEKEIPISPPALPPRHKPSVSSSFRPRSAVDSLQQSKPISRVKSLVFQFETPL